MLGGVLKDSEHKRESPSVVGGDGRTLEVLQLRGEEKTGSSISLIEGAPLAYYPANSSPHFTRSALFMHLIHFKCQHIVCHPPTCARCGTALTSNLGKHEQFSDYRAAQSAARAMNFSPRRPVCVVQVAVPKFNEPVISTT